jgi:hypothetical protein
LSPNLDEDVVKSQKADTSRIGKGLEANAASESNRKSQQNAAGRALLRSAGRAGLAGTALQAGYEAGRDIDERTGLGKAIVEKSGLGSLIDKAVSESNKVELSPDDGGKAKAKRMYPDDLDGGRAKAKSMHSSFPNDEDSPSYRKGGSVNSASRRGDGIAQRGKTRGSLR